MASVGFPWSTESISKLIELYEQRPCLYNTTLKAYFNRDLRSKAMAEMTAALKASGKLIHSSC